VETLRIAWFNWKCIRHPEAGGAERFTHEIASRLVDKGHEVTLVTSRPEGLPAKEEVGGYRILRAGGRYTVYLKARKMYMEALKGRVDLVVDEINALPFFTVKYAKEPIVALIHHLARECWLLEVKPPISWIGYILEPKYLSLYKRIPTITVSESTKRDLEKLAFERIYVVPNGLDMKPLEKPPEKNGDPTIIFLGRLKKTKQPDHAIKAFKLVAEKVPDAKLLIVGDGPLKSKLHKLVKKLKLEEKVTIYGRVDEEKKIELLREAQALIFPAVREGWGLVVLEANACGTPAVGYDVPGLRDSIRHMETGILVPYGDIKEMAKAMITLIENQELWTKMAENALQWAKQHSWDISIEKFNEIIKNIL
jgi:glycosyltransferase involved in cell wall biosynthesis